jgi:hypothetical protein
MAVLVATVDGYHVVTSSGEQRSALEGHRVEALSPGPRGTWIAVVDRHEIWQHGDDGKWSALAATDLDLTCVVTVDGVVFAGAAGPRMLRLGDGPGGDRVLAPLGGFDAVAGRDEWHQVGSPLEVRSLSATADGGALLANVHVGGILRSETEVGRGSRRSTSAPTSTRCAPTRRGATSSWRPPRSAWA